MFTVDGGLEWVSAVIMPADGFHQGGDRAVRYVVWAGRAIADYVEEAKQVVASEVQLPPGTRLEWAGQFLYLERAKERLIIVVPVTLLIVFLLLYVHTGSLAETAIVLLAVPMTTSDSLLNALRVPWEVVVDHQ